MKRKRRKNKDFNINQKSFYFEDYLETNQKNNKVKNSNISQDRVYLLFFLFFSLITIFSIKIVFVSLKNLEIYNQKNNSFHFTSLRRDIIDRKIAVIEKDLHETELDYSYLSSPNNLSKKIKDLGDVEYMPMDFSRIYLNYKDFVDSQKKITIFKTNNEKKTKKK